MASLKAAGAETVVEAEAEEWRRTGDSRVC